MSTKRWKSNDVFEKIIVKFSKMKVKKENGGNFQGIELFIRSKIEEGQPDQSEAINGFRPEGGKYSLIFSAGYGKIVMV